MIENSDAIGERENKRLFETSVVSIILGLGLALIGQSLAAIIVSWIGGIVALYDYFGGDSDE